jgi:hypothetical protein
MSYGREHLYNELYGGDVIAHETCDPYKTYDYKVDHINCKDICCITNLRPDNNKTCLRSCCNKTSQRTQCSSAYCPICDKCQMCYCFCKCYCYHPHTCIVNCCNDNLCDTPKEVHCKPVYKKMDNGLYNYYCNPYYV